jgi:protein-S-isoprenylcysteine O-methyltransferase Ste14
VTDGPYRIVRHPIYTSYLLEYAGVALSHLNQATTAVFLAWLAAVMLRVSYEERTLVAAFPEYVDYRRRVGRFAPRLFPRRSSSAAAPADVANPRAKAGAHV